MKIGGNVADLPSDLIDVLKLPDDPDIADLQPPQEILNDLRRALAGEDITQTAEQWIQTQRDLQAEAERQMQRLSAGGELDDPAKRGLPGWITQRWAIRLRMPWSRHLAEAVESAKSWM